MILNKNMIRMGDNSLHTSVRNTLILATMCGLFPVSGVTNETSYKLRYEYYKIFTNFGYYTHIADM